MAQFTVGTHNMLFKLNESKWMPDLKKSSLASVVGYQEASDHGPKRALTRFCSENGRQFFDSRLPISWDPDIFKTTNASGAPIAGDRVVHKAASFYGIPAKYNPERLYSYAGLTHIETNERFLFINVHPVAGGTKPESELGDSERLSIYKDWGVAQYWLDIMSFVAKEMSKDRKSKKVPFVPWWDGIVLFGDFNATFLNTSEWYYPANLLDSFFEKDPIRGGFDHIMRTKGSDLTPVRRWQVPANTDHDIHFQTYRCGEVIDFPRHK